MCPNQEEIDSPSDYYSSFFLICSCSMADQRLVLEAVSALLGCRVEACSSGGGGSGGGGKPYLLSPQDLVNIVSLKEFYKQEGLQELDYPSIGTISLRDEDQDLYSSPLPIDQGPSGAAGEEKDTRAVVTIDPDDFFHRSYDYDFTNIKVSELEMHNPTLHHIHLLVLFNLIDVRYGTSVFFKFGEAAGCV